MAKQKYNPLLESGFQEISTGGSGTSGGFEPYKALVSFTTGLQITNSFDGDIIQSVQVRPQINYAVPFQFQQDVVLKYFRVSSQNFSQGRFAVYSHNVNQYFDLAHQEPLTNLVNGVNTITLNPTFTFNAGQVYFVIWITNGMSQFAALTNNPTVTGAKWSQSEFYGSPSFGVRYIGGAIFSPNSLSLTGSGGSAPNSVTLPMIDESQFSYEYLQIGIQNA